MVFVDNYLENATDYNLLPRDMEALIRRDTDRNTRARLICDHIAGIDGRIC
jgi:dGTP triphosphohydrolase